MESNILVLENPSIESRIEGDIAGLVCPYCNSERIRQDWANYLACLRCGLVIENSQVHQEYNNNNKTLFLREIKF